MQNIYDLSNKPQALTGIRVQLPNSRRSYMSGALSREELALLRSLLARLTLSSEGDRGRDSAEPEPVPAEPTTSEPVDNRVYCVWSIPNVIGVAGIYSGPHPAAWLRILSHFPADTRSPLAAGARLRRYPTIADAEAAWITDAPSTVRESLPRPAPLFRCQ